MPNASRTRGGPLRWSVTSSRLRAAFLAIASSLLAACVTERSDGTPCPPVVEYSGEFLGPAAGELASLQARPAEKREQLYCTHNCRRLGRP